MTEADVIHNGAASGWDPVEPAALVDVPTERLEAQMMTLAGHLAAATCAFLVLVGEFDRREGFRDWECLSSAHWLNWRCGVSMNAAREQVRVARALGGLPHLRAEFAAGRLSYSKARAISRVATPATEEGLVRMAQHATAAQMDRACAALRRTQDLDAAEADLREGEADARTRQHLRWRWDSNGDLVVQARLCAEDAETFLAAIHHRTSEPDPGTGGDVSEPDPLDRRRADAVVALAALGCAHPDDDPAVPEIIVHVDAAAAAHWTSGRSDDELPDGGAEAVPWPVRTASGVPASIALLEQLCCTAGVRFVATMPDGAELNLGRSARLPNRATRRALLARDRHCRFPGCERRSRLHAHHIVHWEHDGPTDMDNLLLLCPKHHRAVHRGGWTLTGTAGHHKFHDPDGHHVDPRAPAMSGTLATLVDAHRRHGRDIALHGAGGRWTGDRIDWGCFFAAFANTPVSGHP
jgi:hypothetical protein